MDVLLSVLPVEVVPHERICPLHHDEGTKVCWGKLKNGEPCTHKSVPSGNIGEVPTCGVHRRRAKKSDSCSAQLPCGFQCGRMCIFKDHGFRRCSLHQASTPCYLMKIPIELRQRIYRYLLPAKPIPAHRSIGDPIPPVWLEIFGTNRQIYAETTQLLYCTGSFVIDICRDGLSMCYSPAVRQTYRPPPRSAGPPAAAAALQDYHIQLMLLEQQNRKRLLEGQQRGTNGRPPQQARHQAPSVNGLMSSPPPLSPANFSMIRSFIIEIRVEDVQQARRHHYQTTPIAPKLLERTVFDYCDQLHKLVGRLQMQQITRLQIKIEFGATIERWEEAVGTARFLLHPFRRLRNVAQAAVLSTTIQPPGKDELELVPRLSEYIHHWSLDLQSSRPPERAPVFEAYWQLEDMVTSLKDHYRRDKRLEPLDDYLQGARVARERNDQETFGVIWSQIVNNYMDYLNHQREFQTSMAMTMDRINGLLVGRLE